MDSVVQVQKPRKRLPDSRPPLRTSIANTAKSGDQKPSVTLPNHLPSYSSTSHLVTNAATQLRDSSTAPSAGGPHKTFPTSHCSHTSLRLPTNSSVTNANNSATNETNRVTNPSTAQSRGVNLKKPSATPSLNLLSKPSVNTSAANATTKLPHLSTVLRQLDGTADTGLTLGPEDGTLGPILGQVHNFEKTGKCIGPVCDNSSSGPRPVETRTLAPGDAFYIHPEHKKYSRRTVVSKDATNIMSNQGSQNALTYGQGVTQGPYAAAPPENSHWQSEDMTPIHPALLSPPGGANNNMVSPNDQVFHAKYGQENPNTAAAAEEFVRPEYVDLEINRIAQPGPVPHPDKNFRPYGINNWHMILHDHTLLRYLAQAEIRQIRDYVGRLAEQERLDAQRDHLNGVVTGSTGIQPIGNAESARQPPRLLGDGPYNVDDLTQVWTYCQRYLDRRAQLRNNNAARRSRTKKDAEIYYWKNLALSHGVVDHEYDFNEGEEMAALARAAAAQEEVDAVAEDKKMNKKRAFTNFPARPSRARKAAKTATDATASPLGSPFVATPLGQNMQVWGGAGHPTQQQQQQQYPGYPSSPASAFYYGHPVMHPPSQGYGQPPQHRFNTRARARDAGQDTSGATVASYTGANEAFNTPISTATQNNTVPVPVVTQPYGGSGGADTGAEFGSQVNNSQRSNTSGELMNEFLNMD